MGAVITGTDALTSGAAAGVRAYGWRDTPGGKGHPVCDTVHV